MGDRIGYARVSTDDQNLDLQVDALQQARVNQAQIYADRVSGKSRDRQDLNNCLKAPRELKPSSSKIKSGERE